MAKSIPQVKIGNEIYDIKDKTAREHLIEMKPGNVPPTSPDNKLWIKGQDAEYLVPTYDEHNELKSALTLTDEEITKINGNIFLDCEIGYVDVSDGAFIYADHNYRIRTRRGTNISLKAGDTVESTSSSVEYKLFKYSSGTAASVTQYTTGRYTVPSDGQFVICAMFTDSRVLSSVNDVLRNILVYRSGNSVEQITDGMEIIDETVEVIKKNVEVIKKNVEEINGNIVSRFEIGYVDVSSGSFVYADQNYRIRTPQGEFIKLKSGDTVDSTNDSVEYKLFKYTNGTAASVTQYVSTKYTATQDGDYVMCAMFTDHRVLSSVDDVLQYIEIKSPGNMEEKVNQNTEMIKNIYTPIVWEFGSINTTTGEDASSNDNFRTNKIIHVKKGSVITKTDSTIAVMALFYNQDDKSTYDHNTQILPLVKSSYTFTDDCYVRFVLQNPSGTGHSIDWANSVVQSKIIDCDLQNKTTGIDVAIIGYADFLGNAIAVRFPNGKLFGIDSFIAAAQTYFITDYKKFGINHLDYFMLSHYHKDHSGNVEYLINNGYIDEDTTVFLPQDLITTYDTNIFFDWLDEDGPKAIYEDLYPKIVASGCTIVKPTEGYVFSEAGVNVKFFNCDHSIYYPGGAYESNNYNNLSIGCYVTIGNMNLCDPADMGYEAQQKMVSVGKMVKSVLYCSTHHGWDNGTADNYYGLYPAWISRLSPEIVFSMDYSAHNTFIMTKKSPMQSWCEANGVPNYRTAKNGTMLLHMDAYNWHFNGGYTRYIRNDKNWSFSDNSEHIED